MAPQLQNPFQQNPAQNAQGGTPVPPPVQDEGVQSAPPPVQNPQVQQPATAPQVPEPQAPESAVNQQNLQAGGSVQDAFAPDKETDTLAQMKEQEAKAAALQGSMNQQASSQQIDDLQIQIPQGFDQFDLKDKIFSLMVLNNASDAYPVVGYKPSMKISGKICSMSNMEELKTEDVQDLIESLLDAEKLLKYQNEKEIDFAFSWQKYRFRINAFHQMEKPSLTIRYLRNDISSMEKLGLPPVLKSLSERNSGIVLVCGVTGSGKSTTLAAMVDYINENFSKHIITIEDPVEYTYEKKKSIIEQREVGTDTQSFSRAMKSALRQNPNVLLLGEMRDLESIASAISIAESGHLVFATIHARNSVQCINKIIDAFPADQQGQIKVQLSEALAAIVTQKLIPGTDGKLKLVMEIMVNNSAIANLIREDQTHQIESVIQTGSKEGMRLLDEHILQRFKAGEISKEDAILNAIKPNNVAGQVSTVNFQQ